MRTFSCVSSYTIIQHYPPCKLNSNCLVISIIQIIVFEQSSEHNSPWISGDGKQWSNLKEDLNHCSLTSPHPSSQSEGTRYQQLLRLKFLFLVFKDFSSEKQRNIIHYRKCSSRENYPQAQSFFFLRISMRLMQTSEWSWTNAVLGLNPIHVGFLPLPALEGRHIGSVWIPPWT